MSSVISVLGIFLSFFFFSIKVHVFKSCRTNEKNEHVGV